MFMLFSNKTFSKKIYFQIFLDSDSNLFAVSLQKKGIIINYSLDYWFED